MRLTLLGEVQAWDEDGPVRLGGHRQRCVLVVLLLAPNKVVTVDHIVAQVWADDPPPTARDLVTSYVSRLRRIIAKAGGGIKLVNRRPGYSAEFDPETIDLHRFLRLQGQGHRDHEGRDGELATVHLREVFTLWCGRPFADLDSPWLNAQRAWIEQKMLAAAEDLAEVDLESGRAGESVARLRELTGLYPERERLAVLAVRTLAAAGEPAEAAQLALGAIRGLRRRGLEPSRALRQAQTDALSRPHPLPPARTGAGRAQLPPDTAAFTGRERELGKLIAASNLNQSCGVAVISAIDGMAGIGKTALAVHAAHRLAERYPDGQLFVDLHGFTPGTKPTPPEQVLARLLRALGVAPQQIPPHTEDRAALYRERLAESRTLIILDNAATAAQIRPLLPGAPGCLVIVTSRRQLPGLDDAQTIWLGVLPDADALALFTTIAGPGCGPATDPDVAETVRLCGHIPLALRIIASRLRNRPTWTAGNLVKRLKDETKRLVELDDGDRNLTAALGVSYDNLTAEEQRMFRVLGLHPGIDVDVYAAAALAEIPLDTADDLLERLVDHNLLAQPGAGRYQLHDLVRLYARSRADEEPAQEDEAPVERLLDYLLHTACAADHLLTRRTADHLPPQPAEAPRFAGNEEATAWMEAERANLAALAEYAADSGYPTHAIALPAAMHGFLRSQGHWAQALRLHQTALAVAERVHDDQGKADALWFLGDIHVVAGQYRQATDTLTRALDGYRALGDLMGQVDAYLSLAHRFRLTAHYAQAMETLRCALALCSCAGDWLVQANALATLGTVQKETGQYREAEETLNRAMEFYTLHDHRLGQADVMTDLGEVRQLAGRYAEASDTLNLALDRYRALGNRNGLAAALTNLGELHRLMTQYAEADKALQLALCLYRELDNPLGQAGTLTVLGAAQHSNGQHTEAADTLRRALSLHQQFGNRLGQASALTTLTDVLSALGHDQEAAECYGRSLDLFHEIDRDL